MWRQLINVDSAQNWAETSCTAMFTFAMVTGVKNGWLPADTYGPAARKAWLTDARPTWTAAPTCVRSAPGPARPPPAAVAPPQSSQNAYYLARPRNVGDFHGQAPYLWSASALMR